MIQGNSNAKGNYGIQQKMKISVIYITEYTIV